MEVLEDISADLAKIDWRVFTDRQIAENLTLLDHLAHRSLTPSELLNKSWARPEKHRIAPTLVKMLRRFNTVTRWVMQQILEPTTLHGRAHVLERFISIGQVILPLFFCPHTLAPSHSRTHSSLSHSLAHFFRIHPPAHTHT